MSSCTVPFFDVHNLFFSTVRDTTLSSVVKPEESKEESPKAHLSPPYSFYDLSEVGL